MGESYWQTVLQSPDHFLNVFHMTQERGKVLEGHSAGASGRKLAAYFSLGISSCHEPISIDQVVERLRFGIHTMVREGGVRSDLKTIASLSRKDIDLRFLCLVSDSTSPDELLERGYMDHIVRNAIQWGFKPMDAIRMVTLNVAEHFQLADHIGGIAPGRLADIVLISDLDTVQVETVVSNGKLIFQNCEITAHPRSHRFSDRSVNTMRWFDKKVPEHFGLSISSGNQTGSLRVMELVTDLVTREKQIPFPSTDPDAACMQDPTLATIFTIDRTMNPGRQFNGLISGFGLQRGAFVSTGSWDSGNIVGVGKSPDDMAMAVNRIIELGGGIVVCRDGHITAEIPLPHYGLFYDGTLEQTVEKTKKINRQLMSVGCRLSNPLLTLRTLTCAAIPYLRICPEGLVNLKTGKTLGLSVS